MLLSQDDKIADPIPNAAGRMGISRSQLYVELKQQLIKALKVGSRTIIARAEQDRWLAALPVMVTSAGAG